MTSLRPLKTNRNIVSLLFVGVAGLLVGCPVGQDFDAQIHGEVETVALPDLSAETAAGVTDWTKLRGRLDSVLASNQESRRLSNDVQGAWQILHGVLAYGMEFKIQTSEGMVPAVEYLLRGGSVKGFTLRSGDRFDMVENRSVSVTDDPTLNRGIRADLDPGTKLGQGHRDQWLAYLASCHLPIDQVVQTLDGPRRVDAWLRQIEWDVPLNFEQEYSWTLMALVPYRETSHRWTARDGQDYSIETLLASEVDRFSPESACGGSHRLFAIATALNKRKAEGKAIDGIWETAQEMVDLAIEQAIEYQNSDGTFSSNYFERPGWTRDLSAELGSTGHTLEFIVLAGTDEQISDPSVVRAAEAVCRILEQTSHLDLECGALYHALSGLRIYRSRLTRISADRAL